MEVGMDDNVTIPEELTQDCGLLRLPERALLAVCRGLGGLDLLRLGLACRGLRRLARHPRAWQHVTWATGDHPGVLRVAPALRRMVLTGEGSAGGYETVDEEEVDSGEEGDVEMHDGDDDGAHGGGAAAAADPLQCTRRVRELVVEMCEDDNSAQEYTVNCELVDIDHVVSLLRHYKGHLQVVELGALKTPRLLDAIDEVGIKELYVSSKLMRAYPGSDKAVKSFSFWNEVSSKVAARLVLGARNTLLSFKVDGFRMYKNEVANDPRVGQALARCSKLETAAIPIWNKMSLLNSFPKLRKLCLFEFGYHDHKDAKAYLSTKPATLRGLQSLTVHLGSMSHRGMIKALAAACMGLVTLNIKHTNLSSMDVDSQINVARDLHRLLEPMKQLKKLTLSVARVPSSVFDGLLQGALPGLEELALFDCGVTPKGRAALRALEAARPELRISKSGLRAACLSQDSMFGFGFPFMSGASRGDNRCRKGFCGEISDCEDDDPVPEDSGDEKSSGDDSEHDSEDDSEDDLEDLEEGGDMIRLLETLSSRFGSGGFMDSFRAIEDGLSSSDDDEESE